MNRQIERVWQAAGHIVAAIGAAAGIVLLFFFLWVVYFLLGHVVLQYYTASAHGAAEWIQRGDYKGPDGISCCGVSDCHRLDNSAVRTSEEGYVIQWNVLRLVVPFNQVRWSENNYFWICLRPDLTPRCFFAPPVGA